MTAYDTLFSQLIGFDRLTREAMRPGRENGFPPYNIEKLDDARYAITLAVAGFAQEEISIEQTGNELTIKGNKADTGEERTYLHRGIAFRNFERNFTLADHVKVEGAELKNGMLTINCQREVPEEMKPRQIEIQ